MGVSREPISAHEWIEQFEASPGVAAARERYREMASPILEGLASLGIEVPLDNLRVMKNKKVDYRRGIPLLVEWLPRVRDDDVKGDTAYCLGTKWARPLAAQPMIDEIDRTLAAGGEHDALLNDIVDALAYVVDASVAEDLLRLFREPELQGFAGLIAEAMGTIQDDSRIVDALIEGLTDEHIAWHCIKSLGKLRVLRARPLIEPFLNDESGEMRRVAKSALARIDKNPNPI